MNTHFRNAVALVAILAAGSAFAADAPAPVSAPMPAPVPSAMPAPAPSAMPALVPSATPAPPQLAMPVPTPSAKPTAAPPAAVAPSGKPAMASVKPATQPRPVSACTLSVQKAEKALAGSKVPADKIAMAWQHLDAAKQAGMKHHEKACKTESQMAAKMLEGKI